MTDSTYPDDQHITGDCWCRKATLGTEAWKLDTAWACLTLQGMRPPTPKALLVHMGLVSLNGRLNAQRIALLKHDGYIKDNGRWHRDDDQS